MTKQLPFVFLVALVVPGTAFGLTWNVPGDFATIQAAIDSVDVATGDVILVGPGSHAGAFVTKPVEIKGEGGSIINDGPPHPSGFIMGFRFLAGSDGSTISHLIFEVDLAIMNGAGVDNVTVTQCIFNNAVQAVSNWMGSGWEISHNVINNLRCRNGGGIGILVADLSGGVVESNVVSHNKISGILFVDPLDKGGYEGSGIVLYADFRWDRLGSDAITNNRVIKNKIGLVSDTPTVVDVVAFELSEAWNDPVPDPYPDPVIFDNAVGFNDFRETVKQIALAPDSLGDLNSISRNFGENRGHGLHPSAFLAN